MTKQCTAILLMLLFFAVGLAAQQRQFDPKPIRSATFQGFSQTQLEERVETDTLTPPAFADECALEQTAFGLGDRWGRVGGMNGYGDQEKAQLINNTTNTAIQITEVLVWFNDVAIVNNGNLRVKVYAVDATTGAPDALLGQSDDIKVDQIMVNDTIVLNTAIPFSNPVAVDGDAFFLSVDFSDLYATADSLDLLHTNIGCGSGLQAYERWADEGRTWHSMQEVWSTPTEDFDINFPFFPVVEFDAISNVNDPYLQQGSLRLLPATPNPASNLVRLNYELEETSQVQIEIFSLDGRQIQKTNHGQRSSGQHWEEIDISNFAAGAYIYSIVTDEARLLSRFVVN